MPFDIIIQARFNSTRLPQKILYRFYDKTFLEFLIENLKTIKNVRHIIIASPYGGFNKIFEKISKQNNVKFFSSKKINENDLLSRYYYCAKKYKSKNIIRITSDCPFINGRIVEKMISFYKKKKLNFLTNNKPRNIPLGFDCEILSYKLLEQTFKIAKSKFDKEHVTPWIYKNYFSKKNNLKIYKKDYSKLRLTLDYFQDLIFFYKNHKILKEISTKSNIEYFLKKILKKK
ncbi:hypothetical protein N9X21_03585 [Candidatus Pelagibacter bacterium]|nr:hypothetical protein [Candidatus Pelagibacter bacterium]